MDCRHEWEAGQWNMINIRTCRKCAALQIHDTITELNQAAVTYSFRSGKIIKATYFLGQNTDHHQALLQDYHVVSHALQSGYGKAAFHSENLRACPVPLSWAFASSLCAVEQYNQMNPGSISRALCERYEQWLIVQKDGSGLLIDHALRKYTGKDQAEWQHTMMFTHFDSETVALIHQAME